MPDQVKYKCNPSTLRAQAKYRNANKEKLKAARKAYYLAHKDEILRKNREAYKRKKEAKKQAEKVEEISV